MSKISLRARRGLRYSVAMRERKRKEDGDLPVAIRGGLAKSASVREKQIKDAAYVDFSKPWKPKK